jgi:GAF domain-containing protein
MANNEIKKRRRRPGRVEEADKKRRPPVKLTPATKRDKAAISPAGRRLSTTESELNSASEQGLLHTAAQLASTLMALPAAAIWLLNDADQTLRIQAAYGLPSGHASQASATVGDGGIVAEVFETGSSRAIQDIQNDVHSRSRGRSRGAGIVSAGGVPISSRGRTVGVIEVFSSPGQYLDNDALEKLLPVAEMAGAILQRHSDSMGVRRLAGVAYRLGAAPDFERAIQTLVDSARELVRADSASVMLLDETSNDFAPIARAPRGKEMRGEPPRLDAALTRRIIESGEPVMLSGIRPDEKRTNNRPGDESRSLIGVRVQVEDRRGVLFVNGSRPSQFADFDVHLLQTLAEYVSSGAQMLLTPTARMEQATFGLFDLAGILQQVCEELKSSQPFDFVALQLHRPAEQTVETVSGTPEKWGSLAWKHYLETNKSLRDIQADVILNRPPRIEIIAGWDKRFDRWIYETFNHAWLKRIFVPIVVVRDDRSGDPIEGWYDRCKWKVIPGEKRDGGFSLSLEMSLPGVDDDAIEVIGTVEAGMDLTDTLGKKISARDFDDRVKTLLGPARELFAETSKRAPRILKTRLPHVLQTVADCAMRMVGAASASIHFLLDEEQNRYVYDIGCGRIGRRFLRDHRPRNEGLGDLAINAGKPEFIPDPSKGQSIRELARRNPRLYRSGIKAQAAFPLIVGSDKGVLYLHFSEPHQFSREEIDRVELFVNRAVGVLTHYSTYVDMRERARQLQSLHSVVHFLVSGPEESEDGDLLSRIAWATLDTVAADVVTIHEYIQKENRFLPRSAMAGRLKKASAIQTEVHPQAAPYLVLRKGESVYALDSLKDPTFNGLGGRAADDPPSFVIRESMRSSAGILLNVGKETVAVMFINYRRPHRFLDQEKTVIEILASAASVAIKNRRLLKMLAEDLGVGLRDIVTSIDLPQALSLIAKRAVDIKHADLSVISLLDPATQELVLQARYPMTESIEPSWTRIKVGEGITGWVAEHKKPALVNDLSADERHRKFFISRGSALCVPLQDADDRILGVLGIKSDKVCAFSDLSEQRLDILANHAVIAIQNSENQKHLLADITSAFVGRFNMSALLNKVVDTSMQTLHAEVCSIFLEDKQNDPGKITMMAGSGLASELIGKAKYEIGEGFTGTIAKVGEKYNIKSQEELSMLEVRGERVWKGKFDRLQWPRGREFRNCVAVPLRIKDQILGVLKVENKEPKYGDCFSNEDLMYLETIANVVALAVENARLYEQIEKQLKSISASAANRINNQLGDYDGILEQLSEQWKSPKPNAEKLRLAWEKISSTTKSLKRLVGEFESYAKPLFRTPELCNINDIVTIEAKPADLPHNIKIETRLGSMPKVQLPRSQIAEALSELIRNSITALSEKQTGAEGGLILISTRLDEASGYALDVTDNGPGFPLDFPVFEPFRSTSPNRTGLGLTKVKDFVEACGGRIEVSSPKGGGVTIEITIPFLKE